MDDDRSDPLAPDADPERPFTSRDPIRASGPSRWSGDGCDGPDADPPAPGDLDDPSAAPSPPARAVSVRDAEPEEAWMRDDYDRLLDFEPVPRKNILIRGWTPKKQRGFIAALRESGSVRLSTAEVGMGYEGVYKLRHAPGAESFARAWDEAVSIGARRVRDVFIDQNIHGIPERVVIGKDVVVERRRFNHRSMIWLLQHHLPHDYPGGSTTHRGGWGARRQHWEREEPDMEEVKDEILRKVEAIGRAKMREIAADPEKRAAWELLNGPRDWSADSA